MKLMKGLLAGFPVVVALAIPAGANATTINLDFNSLPSAQGWVFEHSTTGSHASTTESGMFSLAGGVLTGDTMGAGFVSPSGAGYNNYTPISATNAWTLTWTMQILNLESLYPRPQYSHPWGFWGAYILVNSGSVEVALGYGPEGIDIYNGSSRQLVTLDVFRYHDYRIDFTPGGTNGLGTWQLFVDSASVATGSGWGYARANTLGFGDGTGAGNAKWTMTAYSFTQDVAAPVPVPPTWSLTLLGLAAVIGFRRRRSGAGFALLPV